MGTLGRGKNKKAEEVAKVAHEGKHAIDSPGMPKNAEMPPEVSGCFRASDAASFVVVATPAALCTAVASASDASVDVGTVLLLFLPLIADAAAVIVAAIFFSCCMVLVLLFFFGCCSFRFFFLHYCCCSHLIHFFKKYFLLNRSSSSTRTRSVP